MRLQGKNVIITGAGSGIGRATAERFAQEGAFVIVADVNRQNGEETVAGIRSAGGEAHFIATDVTSPDSCKEMVEEALRLRGSIHVLFNNAGISGVGALHELEPEEWDRVVNVNIRGVFLPSKYTLPHMMERRSGSIINMSSCIAEIGLARRAVYAATKGAVLALTKSMQVDYASYGIRINALLPGTILTPFVEHYIRTSYADPTEAMNGLKKRQLSEELGTPEDVANAALFLASDESKFIMGAPLYVDGGATFGKNA